MRPQYTEFKTQKFRRTAQHLLHAHKGTVAVTNDEAVTTNLRKPSELRT